MFVAASELRQGIASTPAEQTLRNLLHDAELDREHYGTPQWNPLAELIAAGSKVVLKPNWVSDRHHLGEGLDSLVTHVSVIDAVLSYVAKTRPASVVVGDAPLQACNFERLMEIGGVTEFSRQWKECVPNLSIRDFRRTRLPGAAIGSARLSSTRTDDDYVLFDLGDASELESISNAAERFRVTMYDPDALRQTHAAGKHQYLVAREIIEADVVINLPKLKTHKKSGVTGALKNMVGINGLKDYLPHHRKGGSLDGGDCYQGRSRWKRLAENALDSANRANAGYAARMRAKLARLAGWAGRACGHDANLEGSWHGNDTIWRTTLDLQRIVRYGQADGRLADTQQREIITLTDAIVAGEGEGPLAPTPVPLGMMTLARSPAAAEWVHALLMGLDPERIPLVREAFRPHPFPLVDFSPDEVEPLVDGQMVRAADLPAVGGHRFLPPAGWSGHCELEPMDEAVRCSA